MNIAIHVPYTLSKHWLQTQRNSAFSFHISLILIKRNFLPGKFSFDLNLLQREERILSHRHGHDEVTKGQKNDQMNIRRLLPLYIMSLYHARHTRRAYETTNLGFSNQNRLP